MATSYTSLLGFALPVTGELSGTWGDVVNNSITQLVEDSVAGVATQSVASADWTLTTTGSGQANQARSAILRPTGSSGSPRNIIAPSSSKAYIVDNQSNVAVTVKGAATTGVAVAAGTAALVAWNGSDFVLVAQNLANATGTLGVANGGTGQTTYTDGQLLIGNTTGNTLTKATLTQGTGVTITNGNGSITIAATGSGGTVTNVQTSNGPAAINGLTLTGGPITGSGTITLGGGVNVSTITTGTLPVARGGTGLGTVGTSGNVLTSNGTAWVSQAAGGGANIQTFAASGTYTKPPGAKFVQVEMWGAGGGGGGPATGYGGGGGAYTYKMFAAPAVGATETVTVGAGGGSNVAGGATTFGTLLYAGGGGTYGSPRGTVGGVCMNINDTGAPDGLARYRVGTPSAPATTVSPGTLFGGGTENSVWGGGAGVAGFDTGYSSIFGGGGGGGWQASSNQAGTGGAGGLFGRVTQINPSDQLYNGGGGAVATTGGAYQGGGGAGPANPAAGNGGLAAGGGGKNAGTGGTGGNGYAVVYTW